MDAMLEGRIEFPRLDIELGMGSLGAVAGWHDLERPIIPLQNAAEPVVVKHEGIHDQLLTQTPFGNLQFVFNIVRQRTPERVVRENATAWCSQLLNVSRRAHECCATYLAIKSFPRHSEQSLVNRHPDEYKRYFYDLANVIDTVFRSSYVQYLVGKMVVEVCMAPRLQEQLIQNWSPTLKAEVQADDAPDSRLATLLPELSVWLPELEGEIRTGLARRWGELSLPYGFDFQEEDAWLMLPGSTSDRLDALLDALIREWMYVAGQRLWPCAGIHEWAALSASFIRVIENAAGNVFEVDHSATSVARSTLARERMRDAARHGTTVIDNRPLRKQARAGDTDELKELEGLVEGVFVVSVLDDRQLTELVWTRIAPLRPPRSGGTAVQVESLPHAAMQRMLGLRKAVTSLGAPLPSIQIVARLHSSAPVASNVMYQEILMNHQIGSSWFGLDRVVWYLGGDFLQWYDILISRGGLEGMTMYRDTDERRAAMEQFSKGVPEQFTNAEWDAMLMSDDPPLWFVFRSPALAGLFLRILPAVTAQYIFPVISDDLREGRMAPIPLDERNRIGNSILELKLPLLLSFDEL